ncbi:CPBP family intramembrane glutamic endopeptidase [Pseudomonas sp. CNPSo 3701]|uniref:CPBP family intramembrane glutamic endopeptidase n=1 Tax=Pseudomonas sp. CNPSo 3701 TaxID=3027943 RepID=UPI00236459DB|nr:CPBP family intramembrane glutamic endopeptidase [Pseudomonas sp. CNPSo 3701]MDD1509312.1 CPBP family intramembrane metalloprotease [Pseudomonas sp. CNPSo 3701]
MTSTSRFTHEAKNKLPRLIGRWCLAIVAVFIFIELQMLTITLVGPDNWNPLWMLAAQGLAGAALLLLAMLEYHGRGGIRALMGNNTRKALHMALPLVAAVFIVTTLVDAVMGGQAQPFIAPMLSSLSVGQKVVFFAMLLTIPALSDELLYRHFLIRLFPMNSRSWQWVAVMVTTVVFVIANGDYHSRSSFVLMACLGAILGVVRICSGGLAAPILLHGLAMAAGLASSLFLSTLD